MVLIPSPTPLTCFCHWKKFAEIYFKGRKNHLKLKKCTNYGRIRYISIQWLQTEKKLELVRFSYSKIMSSACCICIQIIPGHSCQNSEPVFFSSREYWTALCAGPCFETVSYFFLSNFFLSMKLTWSVLFLFFAVSAINCPLSLPDSHC